MASDRTRELAREWLYKTADKSGYCNAVSSEDSLVALLDAFERETLERAATHVPVACEATRFGRNPEYFIECTCGWNLNGKICRGVGDHGLWEAHIRELAAQPTPEVKK